MNLTSEQEKLETEAHKLYKELESVERFSKGYFVILRKVTEWTEKNNRPLIYTYDE